MEKKRKNKKDKNKTPIDSLRKILNIKPDRQYIWKTMFRAAAVF